MSQETIDQILQSRKQGQKQESPAPETQQDKFFSILVGEGSQENFFEIQSRDGLLTCFSYADLIWIVYDPATGIMLEFGGYLVSIEGRGLHPRLFLGIKQKRVAWVKEADSEMQDHKDNDHFIAKITISPPKELLDEAEEGEA